MNKVTTLNQFIIEQQAGVPQATGGFSCLLHHVGIAAKKVNREVNKAGLVDMLGRAGAENIQGEDQQKLDVYANETFMENCLSNLFIAAISMFLISSGCSIAQFIFCNLFRIAWRYQHS